MIAALTPLSPVMISLAADAPPRFVEPRTVRLATVIDPGKLISVDGLIATAFQFEFVIITVRELLGREASDQFAAASQLPLAELIHEFT